MTPLKTLALLAAGALLALPLLAQTGDLRVVSRPGVRVVWEGVDLGVSDGAGELLIEKIPLGTYSLLLAKPGHEPLETTVTISEGRTTVSLQLEPLRSKPAREAQETNSPPSEPSTEEAARPSLSSLPGENSLGKPSSPDAAGTPAPARAESTQESSSKAAAAEAHAPAPVTTDLRSSPPSDLSAAPPPETTAATDGEPAAPLLVPLLIALLLGTLLLLARGFMARATHHGSTAAGTPLPDLRADGVPLVDEPEISSILREQLRRREASLEKEPSPRRPVTEAEVIDIADFEVIEGEP